jgi:hypothetical protein
MKKWPEKAMKSVQREIENDWISALSLVKYTLYIHTRACGFSTSHFLRRE